VVKGELVMAMDFASRKGVKHEKYSYRINGAWYVCNTGPRYTNAYRVTEVDDSGFRYLLSIEDKVATAQRSAPCTTPDSDQPG
jgi:hypothetical protein